MRPKKFPYSQKRPFPSQERVKSYSLAIQELEDMLPSASDSLKEKIEDIKKRHLDFLKPWDFEFLPDELKSQIHVE